MTADERPIFARLRRMRREVERRAPDGDGRESGEPTPDARGELPPGVPAWLREKLGRSRAGGGRPGLEARPFGEAGARGPTAPVSVGPPARLVELAGSHGTHAARLELRARESLHGAFALEAALDVAPDAFAPFARDGSLARVDLARAVYLDIETTGLSGGAGTYPFLVALGTFAADRRGGFHVWQGFLREPDEEPAMLAAAAERIAGASAIVSFFGKSFDRHRLEDKMRLHAIEPPFDGLAHLDLYHPCARLYAPALPDGKLQTMERALCGVTRTADLPGAFAPEAWFDFLAARPHRLEAVFRHNLDDVLSLVTLAAHLGRATGERGPDGADLSGPAGSRAWGLARLASDRGDHAGAAAWCERALSRLDGERRAVRLLHAESLRRLGEHARANAALLALCDDDAPADEHAVSARIALAKDAEHRERDPRLALAHAEAAARALERGCTGAAYARHARDLNKRVARLRAKAES